MDRNGTGFTHIDLVACKESLRSLLKSEVPELCRSVHRKTRRQSVEVLLDESEGREYKLVSAKIRPPRPDGTGRDLKSKLKALDLKSTRLNSSHH